MQITVFIVGGRYEDFLCHKNKRCIVLIKGFILRRRFIVIGNKDKSSENEGLFNFPFASSIMNYSLLYKSKRLNLKLLLKKKVFNLVTAGRKNKSTLIYFTQLVYKFILITCPSGVKILFPHSSTSAVHVDFWTHHFRQKTIQGLENIRLPEADAGNPSRMTEKQGQEVK